MEKNINWDDFTPVSSGNADDVNWSDFSPVNAQESGALSDLGKSLKSGVQKLPGIVTGLADLPAALLTGYRPFTEAADWMGEATGFQPGKWAKDTKFSQGHEDSRKEVDAAWQDGSAADIAKAYISNPNYTLNQVVESLPSMAAGGYASKALMGAGAAAGVVGDAAAGVATKAATPGLLARTVGEKWAAPVAGGAGEGAVTAGQQMDDYTGEDQQKNAWASLGAGAGTGLIGVGAGRLANHLGFETAETAMAKIGQRETVDAAEAAARAAGNGTPDVPLSAKRRILGGMVSEGLLQELPQSAQEQMWQNYANDKPLMEGVTRAGVEGALAGVVMGAGANVRGQGNPPRTVEEIEQQVSELPEHQQNAARATLNAQLQAEARMAGLAEEEQGQQDVPPGNPNDYRATPAWAKPPQDAEQDFGNYDDEILQSTGMEQRPTPHPVRTAVQDAADAGGGLSAAAGLAMDSGITPLPAYMPPAIQEQAPQEPAKPKVVLQNRDRSEQASIAQMQEIRRDPQYLKVGPSNNMTDGAPVVIGELPPHAVLGRKTKIIDGKGGVIEVQYAIVDASDLIPSHTADGTVVPEYAEGVPGKMRSVVGIARTSGLQAAYADGNANQYKQDLLDDSPNQHIDAGAVTTPSPMLVRVMSDADVMPDIGDRSNISNTLDLSPKDQAANDARRVKIREMSFDEKGNPTQDSLLDFIAQTPTTETSKLITSDSQPSRQAVERFRAATFHEAYQDPALTELYTTEPNPEAKLVLGAAADAAGLIANLRGTGEFDVGDALTDAVRLAVLAARQNVPIDKLAATRGLEESDQAYEEKLTLARFLADNRQSKQRMSDGLRRWGQLVLKEAQTAQENQRQGGMFGATPTRSRQELFATLGSADNPTAQALNERTQQTEAVTAPLVDEQAPAPQQQPAPLPVPGNYTGAPSVTMGTRTEASAGPAFGLKDALAMIRAKKRGESEAAAPVAAPAPEIFSPEQNTAAPALGNAVRQQTQNQSGLMSGQVDNSLNVGSLDQYTEKTPAQQDTPVDTAQAWASMPTDQRKAVAAEAGLPPIVSNNIGKAQWEAINPKAQGKLAEVMAAQAQPAQEQEAVPEDAPPALTPYAPADIEQRQAQQTEATRAEAEAAADAQAKPEAAQEEASVKKPGRGVLAKLEAQRAQKQREQEDADASAKAAEQVRNAELVYNAKRRLAAAYRNEPHGGIDEDYETLRGMLEVRANDSDNPNSGMARDVLDSFDDSIANAKLKEGRTQPQAAASEAPTLELTGQTAEEARAQAASQQAEAARKQGETTQAQSEDERKRIAAASVKAADSFELGQDPMDSLTGQKDVFGAMEEAPEPPAAPKNLKEGIAQAQQNAAQTTQPEATGKTLARSAAEKVLGNRFELSENDKEAKNVSAIAGTKDAYITQGGKELHIVEAVANENLKNATTEAIQEALAKRSPGTDAAKRLQAELDNRGGAVAKPASLKEGIAQARANKAGAAQAQYNNGKLDTDPNDMDAAKIERGYSNLSHNLTAKVEMERKWYVDAVQAFHDALAPVAQAEQQAEKLGDLVDAFKADYVQRRNRVLTVAESSYSAAIAGRSKLNTGQVNTRADAWARAEQAFSQWVAEEKEIAKAALLELRTEGQRDADKQSAENKRVTGLVEPVVRSILNLGAIDEGQMPGMSRSSFADSASRKMAALHKNGEVAALEQVFEAIDEWDAAHKKPLFTSKSPVWGYRPAPTAKPVQSAKAEALRPALTPAAPVQQAEAAPVVKAPAATVSTNTVFTEDAAAAARARLKKKLGQLNSGLDPEMMMDGITLAGYHIEKGARTFAAYAKAMLADLGDGVKPYLKSWYMGVKYDPRATTFTGMDSAAVVDSADIDALMAQKDEDVPSTDARVERDSQVPAAESAVGDTVSADPGTTAEGVGKVGGRTGGKSGSGQQDGAGVPFGSAPVAGERGDQRVHTGEPVPELAGIIAGTEFSERSGDDGVGGVPPDSIPASKVEATANQPVDRVKAGVEQARANNAPVKLGDIDSIKATLPQLHPGQQDDVQKAEKRFATPDGYGMLFTNGTGTGKTFSGLGVVKRFALQGKTNTLIVVPDDKIANDWIESAKLLGLDASKLESTKDAGNGIVITSYANLGENDALAGRDWDLVVADEVHTLMQAADGTETGYLQNLRAITHHPDGMFTRYSMQNRDKIALLSELTKKRTANTNLINSGDATDADVQSLRTENTRIEKQRSQLIKELDDARKEMNTEVEEKQGAGRTRLVALSATPFAYEKTVDWANGYLFDYKDGYPHNENSTVYNQPTPREYFFQTRFGYRMRYGKLTAPDSNVDSGMMQRQFNGELKKSGALSGRMLDVPHDYDRRFVLVNSAIGNRIDEALEWLNEARRSAAKGDSGASELAGVINEQFKYLQKRYLLEAIKASEAVPIIKQHMALGRKVVVFHDYKKGGASNPFKVSPIPIRAGAEPSAASVQFNQAIESFNDKFADLINHPLLEGADSPIEVFSRELPGTLFVNGNEKKADLLARYKSFQDDATGPQVMLVQSAKNKGWSGHDTTGKHQRVLINLGQPTAPTMAVQQEGRIYRTGQASDAIMRYMNTGTNWERWTFASTIASRASTAENLGMGEQARALKDSFINAFEQSDTYAPGHEGEGKGGKDQDAAANNALTEYDRAKSLYFANQKKTSKTKAAEGVDYFATPEPVGLKMVEWLDVRSGEDVLEPSGGHGAIARWFPEKSNKTVIEPSLALRSRLALAMNAQEDRLLDGTFEEHNVVNKYDGIVMNPPFGVGGKTAIEHLAKAATHLRDGGRIVALIPTGPAADKRFEQWMYGESDRPTKPLYVHPKHGPIYKGDTVETGASWAPVAIVKNYSVQYGVAVYAPENPSDVTSVNASAITKVKPTGKRTERYSPTVGLHTVADIKLPTATFNRAGAAVATRIVVIEKQSKQENAPAAATRQIDLSGIEKISELFDRLEDMRLPVRPKADAAEDAPQKPPAKTAATARAEKAKAQTAKAGAAVKLGGKDYEVAIYTTNAGKELRGVWMATRTEAEAFTNSPFQKRPLGWFVRESNFPAGAVQQAESQSQPADAPSRSRQQSPATPATPIATVRSALTQAYGKLADQLEQRGLVTVVQTQEQAIEAAAQARAAKTGQSVEQAKRELMDSVDVKRSADGNVQGFFDPQSGQAFLVADHLTAEAAPGVLMHEVGIHMAADGSMKPLFNRAKLMLSMQKNDPFMQRVQAKMDAAGETSGEEVAAYMVEEYERSRTNAPASVARWLSDLLASVKAWMHRKGIIGADSLTVADIAAVARANAKSLAQGQVGQQSNAEIRFSRTAAAINASTGALNPKQQQANDRVFGLAKEPTLKEQFDALKANFGLKARQALVDQFAAIKQLDPKAYMLARMSKASDGTLEAALLYGMPFLNNGVPDVKIGDGGFANVLASLNGEHYRFMKWVAAQRAERLKSEGKENLMTDDDISALKTLNQGQMPDGKSRVLVYGSAMDKLNAYNEAMLKMAMESGHIDQDTFNVMKDQPYVPFYRIMEDEKFQGPKSSSALVNQKAWHKLKGGTNQLNADLLQNMLMNWSHLLQASARNRAALATMDEAEKMAIAYQVPATTKGAVRVMRDGFAEHWMVEDPHLLEAVGALNYTVSPLMKPLTKMKQILTMAVTVNPTFKIRNLIRDSVSAIAQSELSYNPVANVAKGWKLTASDSQIYASMLAGGGLIKFGTQENTDRLRLQIEKLGGQVLNKTTAQGLMDRASKAWDAYSEFGDRTENVNRVALYDKLRKMGRSHAEASFESRDLMDFSMGGTMPLVRFLTQTVPFLNARLVGLDKLGRAAVADPRKFGTMAAAVAIASVALMMMYGDDDDWKKREDWDRDAYWWFKIGGTAFRIPKPFEVGAIGTMAERTFELMFEKEMTNKRFRERIAHMFSQTFAFDPVPQAVKPLLDVYSNKDSFTKRAIESQSDQRMRPQDRYNERTSEVARMLGKLGLPEPSQLIKGEYVGLSPKQIDHLIKGYFSWVGVTATAAADAVIRPAMGKGERPDMRLKDMFMVGNFVETLPTGSSRYVTQMYEQARQINQAYASYREALKSGEVEKAKDIKAANIERFRNRLVFDHAQEQLSKLNQQAKKIEASRAMTGEEKRQRLTDIEQRRGAIAQRVSGRIAA